MADTQIINAQSVGVPSDYVLPASVELQLKAVTADMDGSGTAGSWLPAVEIYSDSGDLIARSIDPSSAVAAAGSAEVSWFPGVKGGAAGTSSTTDSFAPQQCADLLAFDQFGVDWVGPIVATVDTACLHNGYVATSGAQNDFIDMRFNLGPTGSLWGFNLMFLTGPNYGEMWGYLGTPSENAPASGEPDPTNLLTQINAADGDFSYVLAFKITCYSAALTRNVKATIGAVKNGLNPYAAQGDFRIGGAVGAKLTVFDIPPGSGLVTGDGGPGVYALKLVAESKVGISTGYKLAFQSIAAERHDWAWA